MQSDRAKSLTPLGWWTVERSCCPEPLLGLRTTLEVERYRCPPEALMRSPVSHADWSDARNNATRAMSSG